MASGRALHHACGSATDFPGITGGAMTIYAWLGHFLADSPTSSTLGVAKALINARTAML